MEKRTIVIFCLSIWLATGGGVFAAAMPDLLVVEPQVDVRESAGFGAATERHLPPEQIARTWLLDPSIFNADQGDQVEVQQVVEPDIETVKLTDLVAPIHFYEGEAQIPTEHLSRLREVLDSMRHRDNVRLHFVGHADSQPLSSTLQAIYGDNIGLSRERAGTTAEYFQQALNLPPEGISYEGVGASQPLADNATETGRALNRRVEVEVWYDEIGEKTVDREVIVPRQVNQVKVCRTETVCKLRYREGHEHRARIRNLVAPLHYREGMLTVPDSFQRQIEQSLDNLRGKRNPVVKFIAYSDTKPLDGREKRIYEDHLGLTKAVARRVSLAVGEELGLTGYSLASEGKGTDQPVASNDTPQGRSRNRRVEVEFWYDDPLQDLPDEPQICPDDSGAETVTRIYEPPGGSIEPIRFEQGNPVVTAAEVERLRQQMDEISDRSNVRLRFIGYIGNKPLDRRTAAVYGDDIGWSTVRAVRVKHLVSEMLGLTEEQTESEGRGYVQADDVVNEGFLESNDSRVEVQIVYDELLLLDDFEGVEITRMSREIHTEHPYALNLMRISVDGRPLDDPGKDVTDLQRCTDVALDRAQVRFKHNSLQREPRLNVTAWPRAIRWQDDPETAFVENRVGFRLYLNYRSFIDRAEVRIFDEQQSVRDLPLAVVVMDEDGLAAWQPEFTTFSATGRNLKYLVRVYDSQGRYDETVPQPLWVTDRLDAETLTVEPATELLAGYGESRLATRQIPLHGGTVQAYGQAIPTGYQVWLAGYPVPVDREGKFVAEEILPEGVNTVEVAVLDQVGNGELFLRDLELEHNDWFTVGIADLTLSASSTDGPANLVAPDEKRYREDVGLQGRLAFFTQGRFGEDWGLTASADTREEEFDEIFSNFLDKSPEALFRRIDPDYHLPTYGDDSTVTEVAPTSGKFYLKLDKGDNYGLWGNFKVDYTDNSLAHVDRGLYGARLHYQTGALTTFGERRLEVDGFAAEPGTVAGRDEFRGTGGSLYYLRHQDLLQGSERVRIEVRDKESGLVLSVKNLTPGLDYDVDYLQGRMLLNQPLSPSVDDGLLVQSDTSGGHPAFLVVRYEFTPGFDEPDTLTAGGRLHYWVNDHIKVGVTASDNEDADETGNLGAVDVTLRKTARTWLKLEAGRSEGSGVQETTSLNGGFNFTTVESGAAVNDQAEAHRVELSVDFSDFFAAYPGHLTLYQQEVAAGYSAPGLLTAKDTTKYGGTLKWPVSERVQLQLKADRQVQQDGLETDAGELNVDYQLSEQWTLSSGVRHDRREDHSTVVPPTQEEGERTDALLQLQYDSLERWTAYGFLQDSLQTSGNREQNARFGSGGSYRVSERFKLNGELSSGDLGEAARLGSEYLYSDRTTLYLNYALENERSDNGLRAHKGSLASGFRTRYSDSASVFLEERYTHGEVPTGLTHATGVELALNDRLNLSANLDYGILKDQQSGAEIERTALGLSAGYGFDKLKLYSAVEYRLDDTEQVAAENIRRTTWLLKNSLRYQVSPDWRLIGKLNLSRSDSSQGTFYDGSYTEAVLGSAYRPVANDRLNALLKYTYFANLPTVDQLTGNSTETTYVQRSHIASFELMYDLTERLTIGGKYAYRYGEVSQDRVDQQFFSSRAHLYVLRTDWHVLYRWDALVEGRILDLPDAGDQRSGILLGIYRHLGNHAKLGVGYNFSKFSDDLTDLDYKHQGLFINLVGKF